MVRTAQTWTATSCRLFVDLTRQHAGHARLIARCLTAMGAGAQITADLVIQFSRGGIPQEWYIRRRRRPRKGKWPQETAAVPLPPFSPFFADLCDRMGCLHVRHVGKVLMT